MCMENFKKKLNKQHFFAFLTIMPMCTSLLLALQFILAVWRRFIICNTVFTPAIHADNDAVGFISPESPKNIVKIRQCATKNCENDDE